METPDIPHIDKLVGEKDQKKIDYAKGYATGRFDRFNVSEISGQLEKTAIEKEVIKLAIDKCSELMNKYGRKKEVPLSVDQIRIVAVGDVEKHTDSKEGAVETMINNAMIERQENLLKLAAITFHEALHLKSYKATRIIRSNKFEGDDDIVLTQYRSGISARSTDKNKFYLHDLEEGIIGLLTARFVKEMLEGNKFLQNEYERLDEKGVNNLISRAKERRILDGIVDELFDKNKDKFSDRSEVEDLFIEAQINGNLLSIAKLVESSFGKGSFRHMAEYTARNMKK